MLHLGRSYSTNHRGTEDTEGRTTEKTKQKGKAKNLQGDSLGFLFS
jgi:hypothetical protein